MYSKLCFSSSHVWMWKLDHKEGWALKNCCFWTLVLKNTLESPLECKEIKPVNPKGNQPWIFIGMVDTEAPMLTTWCEEQTHWKRPWYWEGLKAGGEGEEIAWYGWRTSLTQWTWIWADSGKWWKTGRPGMLHSVGSQRFGLHRAIEHQ